MVERADLFLRAVAAFREIFRTFRNFGRDLGRRGVFRMQRASWDVPGFRVKGGV